MPGIFLGCCIMDCVDSYNRVATRRVDSFLIKSE